MIRSLAIPFGAGLLLLVCSTIIEKFAISSDGLDRNGNELIVYSFARLGLALLIGYTSYVCGRLGLRIARLKRSPGMDDSDAQLAATLILGFAILSLLMFVFGLFGLYYRYAALGLMIGLFALAPAWSFTGLFDRDGNG